MFQHPPLYYHRSGQEHGRKIISGNIDKFKFVCRICYAYRMDIARGFSLLRVPHVNKVFFLWYTILLFIKSYSYHYGDVIMGAIASQITSLTIVYSTVFSDADQRKHQSSASLAFVWGIHRGSVNSPHKWPVTRKIFLFDDVIMCNRCLATHCTFICVRI